MSSDSDSEVEITGTKVKQGIVKKEKKEAETEAPETNASKLQLMLKRVSTSGTKHKKRLDLKKAKKLKSKIKNEERKKRREEREALGDKAPPKMEPHTLETLREHDETYVEHDDAEAMEDEFSDYFNRIYEPKVLITSSPNPHRKTRLFMMELSRIIPNSELFHRKRAAVKKMIAQAIENGFTDVVVINEHDKEPCSLLLSRLPEGPTAFFKVSNVKLTKHIKRDWREMTSHRPEVLTTNFRTKIGITFARMLASIFHYDPQFKGRRLATFHNQRDYIFFRHHRYEFKKNGEKVALREIGPRFTLKPKSLQKGTFDSKTGEYKWIITNKRHEMETSRRKFFL